MPVILKKSKEDDHKLNSLLQVTESITVNNQNNKDPINDTVIDLMRKTKSDALVNEIYMAHLELTGLDPSQQSKEEETIPKPRSSKLKMCDHK